MRLILVLSLIVLVLVILSACTAMKPQQFEGKEPRFVPEEYFVGDLVGQGYFFDRFGKIQTGFRIDLQGSWNGASLLTLTEHLRYDNGETLTRVYEIKKINPNLYEVRTDAIIGVGTIQSYGNALKWTYTLRQKIGDREWDLNFDDWMFLRADGVVLNRAYAKKFGIELGQIFMSLQKK